jgi:plasmid stabilization system protein ParE
MAYRLKFSARALREMGEAQEWYESQRAGLGDEFIAAIEWKLESLLQTPATYAEVMPNVRRVRLSRFPYGLFYAIRGDLVHVLAILHDARDPQRWPKARDNIK